MNLDAFSAKDKAHWAWARTGALVLFLVTAVLLITSLNSAWSTQSARAQPENGPTQSQPFARS